MASVNQGLAPIRILIVEENEADYSIIRDYIQDIKEENFQADWCRDYQQALDAMQNSSYELYFVDYYLTGKSGLDLLTEAMIDACEAPIIMLTGKESPAIEKKATQLGAADFLIKSELTSEKLGRCIRYSLERAANLRELKESERHYRNIFERTNDIIFIGDLHLNLRKVNEAACQIFGYSMAELTKLSLPDLFFEETEKEWVTRKLMQQGSINDYQVKLKTKDDKKIGLLSASFETDLKGKRYVQGIIHEITLLKRTLDITLQMEKLEAKGRVIRTLAHEVRNPLNNIQLSVANLKSSDAVHTPEYLEIIDRNSKRINDLINELMDSTSYFKLNMETRSLQSVMNDALEVIQDRVVLSKIKLNVNYSPTPAMVILDKEKMRIVFLNLLVNAIESMGEIKGMIAISIMHKPDFHEVRIEDTGCGMTEDTIQKMFEPYFTTKANGLGLGLATTYAIVVSHKATIEVTSTVNKGSVFTLAFPAL